MARKINWTQTAMLSAVLVASVYVVSWIFQVLNLGKVTNLFATVPAVSAISGTIGQKVLGFISGMGINLGGVAFLPIFIGAFATVLIGEWVISNFKVPVFKGFVGLNGQAGRLASVIIYGAIPVYAVLWLMGDSSIAGPSLMTAIGLLIHTIAVSIVAVFVARTLNIKI